MPVNLREICVQEITKEGLKGLALDATMNGTVKLAELKVLDVSDVYRIFENA